MYAGLLRSFNPSNLQNELDTASFQVPPFRDVSHRSYLNLVGMAGTFVEEKETETEKQGRYCS